MIRRASGMAPALSFGLWFVFFGSLATARADEALPQLRRHGEALQLIVDGKPFLMRGGEFSNNVYESPDDLPHLDAMLDAYRGAGMNTLLVPISWRSLEPREGEFDFRMIDTLIDACRRRELRVVILWFGAIKNGSVGYAPTWFNNDRSRFFRARYPGGKEVFAISPFCEAAWEADIRAFTRLMERIKQRDAGHHTVIMIQPENETGCQEIDDVRDHSPAAERAWNAAVPGDLTTYLAAHDGKLLKWLQTDWTRAGKRSAGTWPEVFGAGVDGQKVFMAYFIGRFTERVAAAGMAVYPLPMFVNDWLGSIEEPGGPIGGPDFQVMDVVRVATPTAFATVPDIYQDNFKQWLAAFDQQGNPVLVPEAQADARAAQQCWYTYFQHEGLLFSPYLLVPGESDQKAVPRNLAYSNLSVSFPAIKQMEQLILDKQGLRPRELLCFALDKNEPADTVFRADFHGFAIEARATRPWGKLWETQDPETPGFAAIVKMGEDDFVVIGKTMRVEFSRPGWVLQSRHVGRFQGNEWNSQEEAAVSGKEKASILLPDGPRDIQQVRVRFKNR